MPKQPKKLDLPPVNRVVTAHDITYRLLGDLVTLLVKEGRQRLAVKLLAEFDVGNAKDLPSDRYVEFCERANDLINESVTNV